MRKLYTILSLCLILCNYLSAQNTDFEASSPGTYTTPNALTNWTISSQTATSCIPTTTWTAGSPEFSLITTPILSLPNIGNLPNSPLGGTNIARLGNTTANGSVTRMTHTLAVTSTNMLLCYAFAGLWESGSHNCCEQSSFNIKIRDASGNLLSCQVHTLVTPACSASSSFSTFSTFSVTSGTYWSNWQARYTDLFSYIGSTVSIEVTASDCTSGDHYGSLFLDISNPPTLPPGCLPITTVMSPFQNNFCGGSSALINGPAGYLTYSWTAPAGYPVSPSQATLSSLTLTNALAGNMYTLQVTSVSGCIYTAIDTLVSQPLSISAIGSSPTCSLGASGSATVLGSGSGSGYTYTWVNSTNSVVGTGSVVTNLPNGNYSVTVSAAGSSSSACGTSNSSITIIASTPTVINILKPFCTGSPAYFSLPGGSAYQWYNNLTAVSGATTSVYTVTNPCNSCIYRVKYLSSQGCNDSIAFTLISVPAGSLSVSYSSMICQGATNGTVIFSITPAVGSPPSSNSFSVYSSGSTPAYSAVINPTVPNTFTATGLTGGGTYSVEASDGSCLYIQTLTVPAFIFNYTLSTASPTICSGNNQVIVTTFSAPPSSAQYSYTWSPSTFLTGTMLQNVLITPTASPGSVNTIIYTVVVTPSLANCPLTKTIAITVANLIPPVISPIPPLCGNAAVYTITANPAGGVFNNNPAISSNGLLTPSATATGANNFTYVISSGTCSAQTSSSFTIVGLPLISITGNTAVCHGDVAILQAGGADTYTWNGATSGATFSAMITSAASYSVEGTNTLTNCSNTKSITVVVLPNPTLSISGNGAICIGESTTLTAAGANMFSWSTGSASMVISVHPSVTTTYTLDGTSTAGCTDVKTFTVTVSPCTSLEDNIKSNDDLKLYPNPTNGKFSFETQTNMKLFISDGLGRTILEQEFEKGKYTLDLNNYPDGIYFVKMFYTSEIKTVKLIKKD